ncbi:hypothetical protein CYY_000575 [Polysphondylium violaceum]|uniref:3'-5' exonuclease domain-containing protein n=1 Tax=Polysphondylium violaceum TaxID=133409 RepID=A0A8J4VBE1_9MYCE|nr:hypothetical protein CYY_000575 [Polysphondylium violaceum]
MIISSITKHSSCPSCKTILSKFFTGIANSYNNTIISRSTTFSSINRFNHQRYYSTTNVNESIQDDTKLSRGAERKARVFKKLLTLPEFKKTLKEMRDKPLEDIKLSKEQQAEKIASEYIEIDGDDLILLQDTEAIEKESTTQQHQQIQEEKEKKKIKNVYTKQMGPQESSFDGVHYINHISQLHYALHAIKQEKIIGLDCEAIEMGKNGQLSLIQISTESSARVYLFDIIALGASAFKYGLKDILESKNILKIVHDCRRDSEILFHQHQVQLGHIYDVQIAHALVQKKEQGNIPIRRYGFHELTHTYARNFSEVAVNIKFQAKELFVNENTIWGQRPLPKLMIDYASLDAAILIPIYRSIKPKLQSNFDRRFLRTHFQEQLSYFKDSIRQLYPRNLI